MTNRYINVNKRTILFYITYSMLLISDILSRTEFNDRIILKPLFYVFNYIILALFIIQLCISFRWNITQISIILFVGMIIIISFFLSGYQTSIALTFLCIICMRDIDVKQLIKYDFALRTVFVALVILLSFAGVFNRHIFENRSSLGFTNPNTLGLFIINIIIELFYIKNLIQKIKVIHIALLAIAIVFLSSLYISRTLLMCLAFMLVLIIFSKISYKIVCNKIVTLFPFVVAIIGILVPAFFKNNNLIYSVLNDMLSHRISIANRYYQIYGLSVLGQRISMDSAFDSAYMRLAVQYGLVVLAVFIFVYTMLIKYLIRNKDVTMVIGCMIFLLYGLSEFSICKISMNFTLLMISQIIFSDCKTIGVKAQLNN